MNQPNTLLNYGILHQDLEFLHRGSIPYKLKDKIVDPLAPTTSLDRNSIWTLHDGINPKDNSPVSVFEFNLKDPANQQRIGLARNAFKN